MLEIEGSKKTLKKILSFNKAGNYPSKTYMSRFRDIRVWEMEKEF